MVGRVVEIATDGRHLSIHRGFLVVAEKGAEVGRVPMDEIAAVVANAHGLSYTNNALIELSNRGVPIVLCGPNHMPAAIVWPVDCHHVQTGRMHDQIAASLPLKKRLWMQLVRAKILSARRGISGGRRGKWRVLPALAQGPVRGSGQRRGGSGAPVLAASLRQELQARHGRRRYQWAAELRLCRAARRRCARGDGRRSASQLRPDAFQSRQSDGAGRRPDGAVPADRRPRSLPPRRTRNRRRSTRNRRPSWRAS